MPHYSDQQIEAANNVELVAFLYSHGEKLKKFGAQHLWEKHQVWIHGNRWYTHYDAVGGCAILKTAMDCIRLIHYLDRKEKQCKESKH